VGRAPAAEAAQGAAVIGRVRRINMEDKATFLGTEIVCAAFVVDDATDTQVFTDVPAFEHALLTALTLQQKIRVLYVPVGSVKVVTAVAPPPQAP
jgi:hypothetical protein